MTRLGEARHIPPCRTRKTKGERAEERVRFFFLDSGAHSLYNKHIGHHGSITEDMKDRMSKMTPMERFAARRRSPSLFRSKRKTSYDYYKSKEFYDYLATYCQFVIDYKDSIDAFATLDVLFNPEMSYNILKHIENEWGLFPVPVIHYNTDIGWVHRYLDEGYNYIGIGGLGQEITKANYYEWADKVFTVLCDKETHLPLVKTHGFAMTAHQLLIRYPWYSVDSASWAKAGGFGRLYVPRMTGGKFDFLSPPYTLNCSVLSPTKHRAGRNLSTLKKAEQAVVKKWVESCGQTLGRCDSNGSTIEQGVINYHGARKICNLRFYEMMVESLPDWPWPFVAKKERKVGLYL